MRPLNFAFVLACLAITGSSHAQETLQSVTDRGYLTSNRIAIHPIYSEGSRFLVYGQGSGYFDVYNNMSNSISVGLKRSDGAWVFNIDGQSMNTFFGGNVGIGTASPSRMLDIRTNPSQMFGLSISPDGDNSSYLLLNKRSGFDGGILLSRDGRYEWQQVNHDNGSLSWYSYGRAGGGKTVVTFNKEGQLGIGTVAPSSMVDVRTNPSQLYGLSIRPDGDHSSYMVLDRKSGYDGGILWSQDGAYAWQQINQDTGDMSWYSYKKVGGGRTVVTFSKEGDVSIGTTDSKGYRLAVAGPMIAESVKVKVQSEWPDYVFDENYKMRSLTSLEAFIRVNKHLPELPSAADVRANGIDLGAMNAELLKKIEELTLHLIEKDKQIAEARSVNEDQERRLKSIERQLKYR